MIALVYCLRRLPGLSLQEFQDHWLEHHSQFGRRNRAVRRYVQYHTLANDPIREAMAQAAVTRDEPYDGVAIAWFDDAAALQAAMQTSEVADALADEKAFIDAARSTACLTQQQVIVPPQGEVPYVLIECLQRRSDIDRATFQKRWLDHAHIGRKAHAMGLLMGYIQNHTLLEQDAKGIESLGTKGPTWDGVVTAYFESVVTFKQLVKSPLASQESFEDEKQFIDHSRSIDILTRRHVIKDLIR